MRKAFLRYLIYGLLVAATAYGVMLVSYIVPGGLSLDIDVQRAATSEFSAIEQLQHACLIICIGLFIWIASRDRLRRPMAIAWGHCLPCS